MIDTPKSNQSKRLSQHPGRGFLLAGFLVLWGGSIGLALLLKTLLTPESFPVGSDPSFEITLAAFCFLLCLFGLIFIVRGLLESEARLSENARRYLHTGTIILGVALGVVFVISMLLLSANQAFLAQFKPRVIHEPRPGYEYPSFPTPALSQPIPEYGPEGKYLSGPINSGMDKLRVGDIWISISREDGSIRSFEISMNPIICTAQEGTTVTQYAVEKSKQLIMGPVSVLPDGTFFAGDENISLHGVLISEDEMRGTLYLRYANPDSKQTCDLGTFEWNAKVTDNQ